MHTLLPVAGALSETYEQDILTGILISRFDAVLTEQLLWEYNPKMSRRYT